METSFRPIRAVLCGSYRRDTNGLHKAYHELISTNCQVLSPHTLEFDSSDCVRDRSQTELSAEILEEFHLMCMRQADFIWFHIPDGYIGASGMLELGYAIALQKPIYSRGVPEEEIAQIYIQTVNSVYDAQQRIITRHLNT